jgi:hypothetical protein
MPAEIALEDSEQGVLLSGELAPPILGGWQRVGEQKCHQAMRLADQQRVDLDPLIRGGQHRVTEVLGAVVYDRAEMCREPFSSGPVATLAVDDVKRHVAM